MHARRYDASSGRFGVADTILGALSDPLSLNRYLYCESDPVNFTDPTGHASSSVRLSKGKAISVNLRGIKPKKKLTSWDANAKSGQANVSQIYRDFSMLSGALQMHTTAYGARKAAWANTVKLIGEAADRIEARYGWSSRQAYSQKVARIYRTQIQQYYCGDNEHLKETAASLHSFAQDYWYLPVAPTLADWCGYVAEGDVQNTVLYGIYSLLEVVPGGSSVFRIGENFTVKASGKLMLGAGAKTATKSYKPVEKVISNDLNHIFANKKHKLDPLLESFGGDEEKAFRAIEAEAVKHANENKIIGKAVETEISVNGHDLSVRYKVVEGVVRVSTAFVPEEG